MADTIIVKPRRTSVVMFPIGLTAKLNTRRDLCLFEFPERPAWRQAYQRGTFGMRLKPTIGRARPMSGIVLNNRVQQVVASGLSRHLDFSGMAGTGVITNSVVVDGYPTSNPTSADVLLVRLRDRKAMAWTSSNPTTGTYTFKGLNQGELYAAVAFHKNNGYQPVLDSNIRPS